MAAPEYEIGIGAYRFDPVEAPPELPEPLRVEVGAEVGAEPVPPDRPRGYLVQFFRPLGPDYPRMVQQYGLSLRHYIPNLAYVERLLPDVARGLAADPLVRAVVPYQPAFKLSPTIGQRQFRTEARRALDVTLLEAVMFDDADAERAASDLAAVGGTDIAALDDRPLGGRLRLRFTLGDLADLERVARIEDVQWVEEIPEIIQDNVNAAGTNQSGDAGSRPVWDKGLHGEGQVIGIIDSGPPDIGHCFFRDPVNNLPRPAHRKVLALRNVVGSAVGGHATFVAGCAAGDDFNQPGAAARRGSAWAARLALGNNGDLLTFGGASTLLAELNAAMGSGATIHSNSWHEATAAPGLPATYTQNAADVDTFSWNNEDHLVLGSAGNAGEEQGPPGTAKNAICVAAAQADPNEMNFGDGNPGPTADGRRKPDLVGVGCAIQSATAATACGTGPWPGGGVVCATSFATPHIAGAAALVRQYFTEAWYPGGEQVLGFGWTPSGALLKAMLLNSTLDMTDTAGYPENTEGWGLVRLDGVLAFPGSARTVKVWDQRHRGGLAAGATSTQRFEVTDSAQPLKVTLVWADPPGAPGAVNPVINDLDLRVTSPGGAQTFLGNVFAGGVSAVGGAADAQNNVEMVLVPSPATGAWVITVTATAVNVGQPNELGLPAQGYALVASAAGSRRPCLVATSLYGDSTHPDVVLLRRWRDAHLEPGARGRAAMRLLVAAYALVGPPLARALASRPGLASWLRRTLAAPAVGALRRAWNGGPVPGRRQGDGG